MMTFWTTIAEESYPISIFSLGGYSGSKKIPELSVLVGE
jgi:hypothetical protein